MHRQHDRSSDRAPRLRTIPSRKTHIGSEACFTDQRLETLGDVQAVKLLDILIRNADKLSVTTPRGRSQERFPGFSRFPVSARPPETVAIDTRDDAGS